MPRLTPGPPPFEDAMFGDVHGNRSRQIDDVSTTNHTDCAHTQIAVRAANPMMLHHLGRHGSATCMLVLSCTLFPRLFLFGGRLLHIRFDQSRRRRLLVFQFFDPSQGYLSQFLRLLQGFTQFLIFFSQVDDCFCCCHGWSLPERSSLNSFARSVSRRKSQHGKALSASTDYRQRS